MKISPLFVLTSILFCNSLLSSEIRIISVYALFDSNEISIENSADTKNYKKGIINLLKLRDIQIREMDLNPLSIIREGKFPYLFEIKCNSIDSAKQLLSRLRSSGLVEFAEFAPTYRFSFLPNDYNAGKQYALNRVQAVQAWDLCRGGKQSVIAVVDDAIDTSHPDLRFQIWRNKAEIRANGIDDDGNGFIDDWYGWDAADLDNNPNPPAGANAAFFNHGTHCAGIAAASTHNGTGMASVGFNLALMPVKIGSSSDGSIRNAFQGVEYAVVNKAGVISMSWGGNGYSQAFQMLFDYAHTKNIVCVAAAGNDGGQGMKYPAAYQHVISVGSTDQADKMSAFSNFGTWLDVCAPGSDIYSTVPGASYAELSGTSMACPLAAGLCALMRAYAPYLNADDIETCLKDGCDDVNAQNPSRSGLMGSGRINALKSLQCLKSVVAKFTADKWAICKGQRIQFFDSSKGQILSRSWRFPGGSPAVSNLEKPNVTFNSEGYFDVELIVSDGSRSDTLILKKQIRVYSASVAFEGNKKVPLGSTSYFTSRFKGVPPFRLTYTDGSSIDTLIVLSDTVADVIKAINSKVKFWPLNLSDRNCSGVTTDTAYFVIDFKSCDNVNKFNTVIGSIKADYLSASIENLGTIVSFGHTDSFGSSDVFFQKLNLKGELLSGSVFLNSTKNEELYSAQKIKNGFLLFGRQMNGQFGSDDAIVIRTNDLGIYQWGKILGGSKEDFFYRAGEFNSNLILAGSTKSIGSGHEDIYIVKLDSNGNILWSRAIGDGNYNRTLGFEILNSGNFFVGSQRAISSGFTPVILKFDQNGEILISKDLTTNFNSDFFAIKAIDGFLYIGARVRVTSASDLDIVIIKTDTSLNTVFWSKRIATTANDQVLDLNVDRNGNLIVAGISQGLGIGGYDGYAVKVSPNGAILTSTVFGGSNDESIYSVLCTKDDGLLLTGVSKSNIFANNNFNGYLQKIDCDFRSCNTKYFSFNEYQFNFKFNDISFTNLSGNSIASLSLTPQPFKLRSKYICADTLTVSPCRLKTDFTFQTACIGNKCRFFDKSIDSNGRSLKLWKWYFDGQLTDGSKNPEFAFTTKGAHSVSLVSYSGDTLLCSDMLTKTIWITDSVQLTLSHDTQICSGDSAKVRLLHLSCGSGPYTYKWSPADGVGDTTAPNPRISPAVSTLYTLTVKDQNGFGNTASVKINVDTNCCRSYADFKPGKSEICLGEKTVFQNMSRCSPNATFLWRFLPDGVPAFSNTSDPGQIGFNSAGNKTIQLIVNDKCGSDTFESNIGVNLKPFAFAGKDTIICLNSMVKLGSKPIGGLHYNWFPALYLDNDQSAEPVSKPLSAISYILKVTDPYTKCVQEDTVFLGKQGTPPLNGIRDSMKCTGFPMYVRFEKQNGISYKWFDETTSNPKLITQAGYYWLRASTACTDTTVFFSIKDSACQCTVFIPNAFTPNDDAVNDVFTPMAACELTDFSLLVFNRWGEVLYQSENAGMHWDGTYKGEIVQNGLYYYLMSYRKKVLNSTAVEYQSGYIELIR